MIASAGWTALAITVYLVRGGRPSAMLVVSAGLATLQIVVTGVAQESKVFFLQPMLATYVMGSAVLPRPWRSVGSSVGCLRCGAWSF